MSVHTKISCFALALCLTLGLSATAHANDAHHPPKAGAAAPAPPPKAPEAKPTPKPAPKPAPATPAPATTPTPPAMGMMAMCQHMMADPAMGDQMTGMMADMSTMQTGMMDTLRQCAQKPDKACVDQAMVQLGDMAKRHRAMMENMLKTLPEGDPRRGMMEQRLQSMEKGLKGP